MTHQGQGSDGEVLVLKPGTLETVARLNRATVKHGRQRAARVGRHPVIPVIPGRLRAYVANRGRGTVTVIDATVSPTPDCGRGPCCEVEGCCVVLLTARAADFCSCSDGANPCYPAATMFRKTVLLALALVACSSDEPVVAPQGGGGTTATGGAGGAPMTSVGGGGAGGATTTTATTGGGGSGGGCENLLPSLSEAPDLLSQTGLYADIATKEIAAYARAFAPQYPLWSDGAEKRRFIYLPECDPIIDNSDADNWSFPVGTRMWKEFSLGDGTLLETRMIHRFGPGPNDFLYATYVWRTDDSEADHELNGVEDTRGSEHDVPPLDSCQHCHGPYPAKGGLPSRYLGFSAIQLSHAGPGVTMQSLSQDGQLLVPNSGGVVVPGDAVAQAALGYLHGNCGNCHNDSPDGIIYPFMDLRLKSTDTTVEQTAAYLTAVNQPTQLFMNGCSHRIYGGDTAQSCIHMRMSERGTDTTPNMNQMPPLATDVVDADGLAAVAAWIATLPAP